MQLAGPLGTLLGSGQWKRASSRGEAGTSGILSVSDSHCTVPAGWDRRKRLSNARLAPCFPPHLPLHSTYCLCSRAVSYAPTCKFLLLGPLHYRRLGACPTSSSYLNRLLSDIYSKPNAEMPNFAPKGSSTRRPNRKMENSQTSIP